MVMSRVVGYYAPVDSFNVGKQQEFAERKEYAPALVVPPDLEAMAFTPDVNPLGGKA